LTLFVVIPNTSSSSFPNSSFFSVFKLVIIEDVRFPINEF
jgi:hypothetical protein